MSARRWMQIAAVASAMGSTGTAMAADAAHTVGQGQTNPNAAVETPQGDTVTAPQSVGGSERMDNTNPAAPLDTWMSDYAAAHNGRITRDEFLNQMGQRWDAADAQHRGYLTPDEIDNVFPAHPGNSPETASPPRTGSDVEPGNMGLGSVKSQ